MKILLKLNIENFHPLIFLDQISFCKRWKPFLLKSLDCDYRILIWLEVFVEHIHKWTLVSTYYIIVITITKTFKGGFLIWIWWISLCEKFSFNVCSWTLLDIEWRIWICLSIRQRLIIIFIFVTKWYACLRWHLPYIGQAHIDRKFLFSCSLFQ